MLTVLSRFLPKFLDRPLRPRPDTRVAAGVASAFVAGQGARVYSLEAFRRRLDASGPQRAA